MMGTEGAGNDTRTTRTRSAARKHRKQARARSEHHELGLAHHHSKRHGTHSVRGMPIQQALQLIPALLEEALRQDVTAAVHEARARGDALVASLVAAAAARSPSGRSR